MRLTSETSLDGVTEQLFTLGEIPGVLWTPEDAHGTRPLILMGHGGGQHKKAPGVLARARRLAPAGRGAGAAPEATAGGSRGVGRAVADCGAVLTAVHQLDYIGGGAVGYWGVSMGCAFGMPLVAAEPRVRAAVLGLQGAPVLTETAAQITVPVQFLVQWDDEQMPRAQSLALFDALGSAEKPLHANPGKHGDLPWLETDDSLRFFARHLV